MAFASAPVVVASVSVLAIVCGFFAWRLWRSGGRRLLGRIAYRHLPRIRRRAVELPTLLRIPMLFVTDRLFPSWRTYAGGTPREPAGTDLRITQLHESGRRTPVVLLGGVYLDIAIRHIEVEHLGAGEWTTGSPILARAGGSTVHVGRRLYAHFGRRSTLITRVGAGAGSGDSFSQQLERLMRAEPWHRSLRPSQAAPDEQCGVSVHLEQRDRSWRTTFTYPGSLRGLTWHRRIRRAIQKRTKTGGVLYISGFFRTNLCQDLRENLSYLSPRVLVCVDHGEFQPEENAEAARSLGEAFRSGHVDVYFCTLAELLALCEALFIPLLYENPSPEAALLRLHEAGYAPPVVILRGGSTGGVAAWVMHHGDVTPIDAVVPAIPGDQHRGRGSTFNADVLGHLLSGVSVTDASAGGLVIDSVIRATNAGVDPTEHHPAVGVDG
jgi:hypothetical protein